MNDSASIRPPSSCSQRLLYQSDDSSRQKARFRQPLEQRPENDSHPVNPNTINDSNHRQTSKRVWFIEGPHCLEKAADRNLVKRRRFLQIGTGQWTAPEYATFFLRRRTASIYAREYGLMTEGRVKIISVYSHQLPSNDAG